MSAPAVPARIGPYRPLRLLGQGGMGAVYSAEDTREPGHTVALKVIHEGSPNEGDDSQRRFVREARILERLRHPNIVTFHEVGVHEGQLYLAMELLSGSPLSAYAGRPWVQLVPLLVQICRGLDYLASQSILHRDLSPDNVFVVESGGEPVVKILDFGIAKDTSAEETLHNFTKTGLLMGKPQFWSPEQIGNIGPEEKLDWRSDVYTLGVIFFCVLAGHPPFRADSPYGYITLHLLHPPGELTAPEGTLPIPADLEALVRKMLAKKRDERPQSYTEIIDELEAALRGAPTESFTLAGPLSMIRGLSLDELVRPAGDASRREPRAVTQEAFQTAPTQLAAGLTPLPSPRPAPDARRSLLPWAAAAAALLGAAGLLAVWRPWQPAKPAVGQPPAASGPAGAGTLALHSVPWARLVSVTDERSGAPVGFPAETTTPALLPLPAGSYTVELASGAGPERERLHVEVPAGATVSRSVVFVSAEKALALLE